tara:strand:+ start:95904 stop:96221 length:318 start_codon:yes stop_codon:yes gene_type:complete
MLLFHAWDFDYPEPGLIAIDFYKIVLIIATKDELAEKLYLPLILAFGFQFIDVGSAQIFYTFGHFLLIKKNLVNTDEKFVRPIRIELTAKTVVRQVSKVVIEDYL